MNDFSGRILKKAEDNFVETEVDGEPVIMQIEKGFFFTLNTTSSAIWNAIDGTTNLSDIVSRMADTFNVSESVCSADVKEFVQSLIDNKLVMLA